MTPEQINKVREALLNYSQADSDGVMVTVSRQAVEEAAQIIEAALSAPAQSDVEKDAERWRTFKHLASAGNAGLEVLEHVLHQVFPENEERTPRPDELDALADGLTVALAAIQAERNGE